MDFVCAGICVCGRFCKFVFTLLCSVHHYSSLGCCDRYSVGLIIVCSFVTLCSYSRCCLCDSECCGSLASVVVCCLGNRCFDGMGTNNFRHVFGKFFCTFGFISIDNVSVSCISCNAWCVSSGSIYPTLKRYCRSDVSLTNLYCCAIGYSTIVVHSYLVVNLVCAGISVCGRFS